MIDRYKLAGDAILALNKLRENKQSIITENQDIRTTKKDFSKLIFEEYDEKAFEQKAKIDSLFYKSLSKNISETYMDDMRYVLTNYLSNIREIYEHVNIKPRVYGVNVNTILNESESFIEETTTKIINEFINSQYYSLTDKERESRYFEIVKPIASEMVLQESLDEQVALEFATKAVVVKELLEKISFPMTVKSRIEEDLIDESYGKIFDQDRLKQLWESFQDQTLNFAKIIAATI